MKYIANLGSSDVTSYITQSSVEMFDPAVNQWFQLPDMLVNIYEIEENFGAFLHN